MIEDDVSGRGGDQSIPQQIHASITAVFSELHYRNWTVWMIALLVLLFYPMISSYSEIGEERGPYTVDSDSLYPILMFPVLFGIGVCAKKGRGSIRMPALIPLLLLEIYLIISLIQDYGEEFPEYEYTVSHFIFIYGSLAIIFFSGYLHIRPNNLVYHFEQKGEYLFNLPGSDFEVSRKNEIPDFIKIAFLDHGINVGESATIKEKYQWNWEMIIGYKKNFLTYRDENLIVKKISFPMTALPIVHLEGKSFYSNYILCLFLFIVTGAIDIAVDSVSVLNLVSFITIALIIVSAKQGFQLVRVIKPIEWDEIEAEG